MKIFSEKNVKVDWEDDTPSDILRRIDRVAAQMARDGWFYTHCQADALLENLVLFFEREEETID